MILFSRILGLMLSMGMTSLVRLLQRLGIARVARLQDCRVILQILQILRRTPPPTRQTLRLEACSSRMRLVPLNRLPIRQWPCPLRIRLQRMSHPRRHRQQQRWRVNGYAPRLCRNPSDTTNDHIAVRIHRRPNLHSPFRRHVLLQNRHSRRVLHLSTRCYYHNHHGNDYRDWAY